MPRAKQSSESEQLLTSELVKVSSLNLDAQNPRLVQLVGENATQPKLIEVLWREMAVDEIALSIAANGYFAHEPLFAAREGNKYVVIEGNRRLAAVKILLDDTLRERLGATDLPKISASARARLEELPVVESTREELWQYIGFKHVNGPQVWESYSKATYIAWVHNDLDVPLADIAKRIGDQHSTVKRLYRCLMVLEQAEKAKVFDREDRWKSHFSFSHLYTGLDYPGFQKFLGLKPDDSFGRQPVPKAKVKQLGELLEWLYGSKSRDVEPVVVSQNPDLRRLNDVISSDNGVVALRRGLPLAASHQISKGDSALFAEALQAAKSSLQQARGTVLGGFTGEPEAMRTAEDIADLATSLLEEMRTHARDGRRRANRA